MLYVVSFFAALSCIGDEPQQQQINKQITTGNMKQVANKLRNSDSKGKQNDITSAV